MKKLFLPMMALALLAACTDPEPQVTNGAGGAAPSGEGGGKQPDMPAE